MYHAIYNQVISFIHNSHHGFLTGRSCTTQLLLVHHDWLKALDRSGQVDVVFIDFSKAFDLVCDGILLTKLYKYGVRGELLDWCRDYLTNRQQRVVVKGEVSDWLQSVTHLFSSCPFASSFWSDFVNWYQSVSKKNLSLSKNEILYGVLNGWSSCSTLNHLILIGKYFLYCKALNHVKFQFADFVHLVHDKIETERYIALMLNKHNTFVEK